MKRSLARFAIIITGVASAGLAAVGAAQAASSYFSTVGIGPMTSQRLFPAGAALPDGRVIIAGGNAGGPALSTSEIFDPATNTFAPGNPMLIGRAALTAAALPDGRVVFPSGSDGANPLDTVESYSPATGNFTAGASVKVPRIGAAAATLPDGRVLIAGGSNSPSGTPVLASAEIFNPATGKSKPTGRMKTARSFAVAAPLPDGRILVAGGGNNTGATDSAEIFNPKTGRFSTKGAASLKTARAAAMAARMPDGRILVVGGTDGSIALRTVEIFDPATGRFTTSGIGSMKARRAHPVVAPLPDGRMLIAGGNLPASAPKAEVLVTAPRPTAKRLDFGRMKTGRTKVRTLKIRNLGVQPLRPRTAKVTGKAARDYKVVANRCRGRVLGFREACGLDIRFRPRTRGRRRAMIAFTSNAGAKPVKFALNGKGTGRSGKRKHRR